MRSKGKKSPEGMVLHRDRVPQDESPLRLEKISSSEIENKGLVVKKVKYV